MVVSIRDSIGQNFRFEGWKIYRFFLQFAPCLPLVKRIKHIIWDWNGTLLDDVWLSVKAINIVLERYGYPAIDKDRYLNIFTFPVINYYKRLGFAFSRHPFEKVGTEFIEEYTSRMFQAKLHNGVCPLLQTFQNGIISQSLLSAARQEMLDAMMKHHQLSDYFINVIGQDNHYAHGKIDAGKAWVDQLHVGPHEVLLVGDTLHDVEVARAIGADAVLISWGHTAERRLKTLGVPVFNNLTEFGTWLAESVGQRA